MKETYIWTLMSGCSSEAARAAYAALLNMPDSPTVADLRTVLGLFQEWQAAGIVTPRECEALRQTCERLEAERGS